MGVNWTVGQTKAAELSMLAGVADACSSLLVDSLDEQQVATQMNTNVAHLTTICVHYLQSLTPPDGKPCQGPISIESLRLVRSRRLHG